MEGGRQEQRGLLPPGSQWSHGPVGVEEGLWASSALCLHCALCWDTQGACPLRLDERGFAGELLGFALLATCRECVRNAPDRSARP